METTANAGTMANATAKDVPQVTGSQLPLSFLGCGNEATIAKVRGKGDLHHHLENLGFVEGARIKVVSETAGNLIVEIKGSQVALNKQTATKIITR